MVERYSVMVLSVCRRRCRCSNDAEDAYQTTFLYLARNAQTIKRPECLPGWLQRVAQRAAMATLNAHARQSEPMVETPAKPDDPLMRLTQRHEAIVLDEELAGIPEQYRAALVMHIFDDQPLAALAEHFGTTIGSIRGRLQRGKNMLARRLRKRGIAPVLALAAASAWTVSSSSAAKAGGRFVSSTADGDLPDSPIDLTTIDALLSQGTRLMFSAYTAVSVLGGSAVLALIMATNLSQPPMGQESASVVTLPAIDIGLNHLPSHADPELVVAQANMGKKKQTRNSKKAEDKPTKTEEPIAEKNQSAPGANKVWTMKPVLPQPTSDVAKLAESKLDSEIELHIPETPIKDLDIQLTIAVGVPFTIDSRALAFAEIDPESVQEGFSTKAAPLRWTLRSLLHGRGLKAVVQDHGIVITADPAALVHQGIGISRWINVDDDVEKKLAAKLQEKGSVEFVETPLEEVIKSLNLQFATSMRINRMALEEIGITPDESITAKLNNITLQSTLKSILTALDLTFVVQDESLVITTTEQADSRLLNRIYWLEGTGFAAGDFDSIMDLLQCSIEPDSWEALGGASTMQPLTTARPAILVTTTYTIHQDLERFFKTVRQTHFGEDPVLEEVQVPASQVPRGMGGGGMGGGGGFM